MGEPESSGDFFECVTCGNLGVGDGSITCCERPMRPIASESAVAREPTLEDLLQTVFDMSQSELDVCLCVMESGGLTVRELADQTEYDRSIVSRHLSHLADLGVLDKRRQLLEQGGHVYVYSPKDAETVRQSLRDAFLGWLGRANSIVDDLSREKVEAIVENDSRNPQWKIYKK